MCPPTRRASIGSIRLVSDVNRVEDSPSSTSAEPSRERAQRPTIDRWDRRFRIDGTVAEALKVVVADRAGDRS